jgi:hypothetical protein
MKDKKLSNILKYSFKQLGILKFICIIIYFIFVVIPYILIYLFKDWFKSKFIKAR